MLTALSHEQFSDVDAIDAAIALSKNPLGPGAPQLMAERGVDRRLIRMYEEVVCATVRLLAANGQVPEQCSFSLIYVKEVAGLCEFDGNLAAEYAIDRYRSAIGPLDIEIVRLRGSPTIRTFSLLVDALVLLLLGVAKLHTEGGSFRLEPISAIYSQAKHRIVAQKIDMISRQAHKAQLMSGLTFLSSGNSMSPVLTAERIAYIPAEMIKQLGEILLDRVMAFNPRKRQILHSVLPFAMLQLAEISSIVALAQLCSFTDGPVRLTDRWLASRGIDIDLITEIAGLAPVGSYEFFMRRLGGSVEFSLSCWPDQVLTHLVQNRKFGDKHLSELLKKMLASGLRMTTLFRICEISPVKAVGRSIRGEVLN